MQSRIIHLYEGIATPSPESCLFTAQQQLCSVCSNDLECLIQVTSAVSATPLDKGSRLDHAILLGFERDYFMASRWASKITIPAVKITGDSADDVFVSMENADIAEDHYLSKIPEPAISTAMDGSDWTHLDDFLEVTLDQIDGSPCPVKLTVDALEDPDLGEFLLDGVDWLS